MASYSGVISPAIDKSVFFLFSWDEMELAVCSVFDRYKCVRIVRSLFAIWMISKWAINSWSTFQKRREFAQFARFIFSSVFDIARLSINLQICIEYIYKYSPRIFWFGWNRSMLTAISATLSAVNDDVWYVIEWSLLFTHFIFHFRLIFFGSEITLKRRSIERVLRTELIFKLDQNFGLISK